MATLDTERHGQKRITWSVTACDTPPSLRLLYPIPHSYVDTALVHDHREGDVNQGGQRVDRHSSDCEPEKYVIIADSGEETAHSESVGPQRDDIAA